MAEPESLATDEGLDAHVRRHAYDRLLMLSDGIFAIATTLAAFAVKPPTHPTSLDEMLHQMGRPVLAYFVSFGVIAIFWLSHRDLFARLKRVDGLMTAMTLVMLCLVSLIPITVDSIYSPGRDDEPFRLYAATMIACGLSNAAMWFYAAWHPALMKPEVTSAYRWARAALALTIPILFTPALFLSLAYLPAVMIPLGIAALVLRRILAPRWLKKAA
jgi:uncharacterized membrane protein